VLGLLEPAVRRRTSRATANKWAPPFAIKVVTTADDMQKGSWCCLVGLLACWTMLSRRPRRALASIFVLGLVSASACTSDDLVGDQTSAEEVADEPPGTTEPRVDDELSRLGLNTTSADPFDRISVIGLGDELQIGEVELFMRGAPHGLDVDVPIPVFADLEDPTDAVVSVPFHPEDPLAGGEVELFFSRNGVEGQGIELRIGSMPPAPEAWNNFLGEFAEAIDRDAREAGTTADALAAAGFDDVPIELLPLKFAQSYLDDGTKNSLAGIYDSELLTDEDRVLLDAMTEQMDLGASLRPIEDELGASLRPIEDELGASLRPIEDELGASLRPIEDELGVTPTGLRSPVRAPSLNPSPIAAPSTPAPAQEGRRCRSSGITVDGAADLAAKLRKAQDWTISQGGPVEKVFTDISTVTTVGSFIPGIGWVIGAGGATFAAFEAYHNGVAGMYPSRVTSLSAELMIDEFREDFVIDGLWFDVMAVAESTGWEADAEVANVIFSAAGSAWSAVSGLGVLAGLGSDLGTHVGSNKGVEFIKTSDRAHLNFCAEQWDVDVTGTPWSRASVVLDRFDVDDNLRTYRPLDLGMNLPVEDTLRIELDFRQFRNQMIWSDYPIKVNPIRVTPLETVIEVDAPMELVPVQVRVDGAHDDTLDWNAGPGAWQTEPRRSIADPSVWEYTHIAAIEESAFPYVISARSASTSGLRANGQPPRVATIEVRLRELIISPNPASTITRGTVQFTARDRNGNLVEVDWAATGGSIDANGLYTAGNAEGAFTVTAAARDNPDRRSTATIEVNDAECIVGTWRLQTQPFLDQIMQFVPLDAEARDEGGNYFVEFRADGSFEGRREAWSFAVTTPQGLARTRIDSVERGTWGITGGNQLFINESSSDASVETSVEAAGRVISLPAGPVDDAGISGGQGPFTCERSTLTISPTQQGRTILATLDRIS
jgi:hypothetical protein